MLTQERLRELLTYDPETGIFTYNVRRGKNGKWSRRGGRVAGSLDTSVGYLQIGIDYERHYAHRLAWFWMTGEWPKDRIDHEDTDGTNNKWSNLRPANASLNGANRGVSKVNKLGLKGVSWSKTAKAYRSDITVRGEKILIGKFSCPAAAHFAYLIEAHKGFGEYARGR